MLHINHINHKLFAIPETNLESGELLLVIGNNGAGKTTLCKIFSKMMDKNELVYSGHKDGLLEHITVADELYLRFGNKFADIMKELHGTEFDFSNKYILKIAELSRGQKRKLSMLDLWFSDAKIWILDEPFAHLDEGSSSFLCNRISEFRDNGGIVIITSHGENKTLNASNTITLERK